MWPVVHNWNQDTWCAARHKMSALTLGITSTEEPIDGEAETLVLRRKERRDSMVAVKGQGTIS